MPYVIDPRAHSKSIDCAEGQMGRLNILHLPMRETFQPCYEELKTLSWNTQVAAEGLN